MKASFLLLGCASLDNVAATSFLGLGSSSCSDFSSDSDACINYKDSVRENTCAWCVSDNECHVVGSLENPCSNECCASESSLSTCDYKSADDINAQTCNGTWSVNTFAPGTNPSNTIWPEKGRTSGSGAALHFSGGGSRAMTASTGQVRGLQQTNLYDKAEYMVGVSGGGWFTSAFTYDQTSYSDGERLCPYVQPADLTNAFLSILPDGCMLSAPVCNLYECVVESGVTALEPGNHLDQVWVDCVHKCYLEPFNIDRLALYTYEESDILDIKTRNPNLAYREFILPNSAGYRPYMILVGTVIGPKDLGQFSSANRTFIPVELSSFGSGVAHEQLIEYVPVGAKFKTPVKVGGMVEAFGFGQEVTSKGVSVDAKGVGNGFVGVSALSNMSYQNSLAFSAGITSMAPEALFSEYGPKSDLTCIDAELWPAQEGSNTKSYTDMLLGDGGNLDNFGIFSSLRRFVPRAGVFINTATSLNMSWDPTQRPPTKTDVDGYLCSLFGFQVWPNTDDAYYTFNNQVFNSKDFVPFIEQLQAKVNMGTGAVVTTSHTTVANEFMGIPAGIKITITWNYLSMPSQWYNQLPSSIQDGIAAGLKGPYPEFPYYSTAHTGLSINQVNLLANMATWIMIENIDQYEQILS